jgi:hypothetical protein
MSSGPGIAASVWWFSRGEGSTVNQKARRRELVDEYRRTGPEVGVYRLVNTRTGKAFLGSTLNLGSVRGKLDFARKTGGVSALDTKIWADARQFGAEAFDLEILEVLEVRPEQTQAEIRADLATLEALWRERFDPASLY